jgi:hypothetical protein
MEILTAWPTRPLSIPHPRMLLEIIIWGDFPMIPFFILADIFLVFGATGKIWIDVLLVECNIGTQLTKRDLVHTLCPLTITKLWNECEQLRFLVHVKLNPKLWVPIGPHHYYLTHP